MIRVFLETLAKCSLYSSKLDEKAKKLPNFQMIITEDPRNILKVLDENLIDSEETYRKNLRFIWENCNFILIIEFEGKIAYFVVVLNF